MSLGLANDMDDLLQKPEGSKVDCFASAAAYYNTLKSPQYGYVLKSVMVAQLVACGAAVLATKALERGITCT